MMHKIDRDDIDPQREKRVLKTQIKRLRSQLQVVEGAEKQRLKDMIEVRTQRLREVNG